MVLHVRMVYAPDHCCTVVCWLHPNPVANSCSLDSPPDIGDVPVQAPGPGRFKHRALAGAQGALRLALVQCRDAVHTRNQHVI